MTMQQLIVLTLRKMVQNTELTIPMMDIQERKNQSNSTPPATYTVWLCPICGKQAEANVIECSKCLNWLHYKCENMTVSTYRTHAISNDLEYNCKSCKCMKEMNELTELYQRGDEVKESSIDTTTNNIPTTEETQRM
jgi:predicted RNA-binding Zn-ribbon protein involved in translation (DUF1610 family)